MLTPLRMAASTYEQPLPKDRGAAAATGYYANGKQVEGKWHIYPEMAAAGLWTTASDLARFAIDIQQALAGKSNPIISQSMTRQMLTVQKGNSGLGLGLDGSGKTLRFSHNGRDEGFDAFMMAYAESGQDQRKRQFRGREPHGGRREAQYAQACSDIARPIARKPVCRNGRAWTARQERLLGTKADGEIAKLLKRSVGAALLARKWWTWTMSCVRFAVAGFWSSIENL